MTTALASPPQIAAPPAGMLRAIEVWEPDGDSVTLTGSAYRDADAFAAASDGLTFAGDEGLPGRVRETMTPVVLDELSSDRFARAESAMDGGLVGAMGLPVVRDGQVVSVVLMLFGGGPDAVGAVEAWVPVPYRNEVTLGNGYYGGLERFEKISRHVQFPRGSGLPGDCWETGTPHLLTGLSRSKAFIRAAGADADGITAALGWPVIDFGDSLKGVCVLLSAARSPLVRVMQVWSPHDELGLVLTKTDARPGHALREACGKTPARKGVGVVGRAWKDQTAAVVGDLSKESDAASRAAVGLGLTQALAIPVYAGTTLRGVVALWN